MIFFYILLSLFFLSSPALASPSNPEVLYANINIEEGDEDSSENFYDPFADYNEFQNPGAEDRQIRFFKQGRFLSLGGMGGWRLFTGTMTKYLGSLRSPNAGIFLTYFLDLTTALQASFFFGSHEFRFENEKAKQVFGFFGFQTYMLDLKYYFDKKRLADFVAFFNPYFHVGFSLTHRPGTIITSTEDRSQVVQGFGAQTGAGIEIYLSKRFFMGLQGSFVYVTFSDEFTPIQAISRDGTEVIDTNEFLYGDMAFILLTIGADF